MFTASLRHIHGPLVTGKSVRVWGQDACFLQGTRIVAFPETLVSDALDVEKRIQELPGCRIRLGARGWF